MTRVVIDDSNFHEHLAPVVDGEAKSRGLMPRDYAKNPIGYLACAKPFDLPLIPSSEWKDRFEAQKRSNATLSDIRKTGMHGKCIPSRDQNGKGYCWAHSSTSAALLVRALEHQPFADLSAYSVACPIKNFRDEGGWGAESLEWIAEHGIATSEFWPQKSMDRANPKKPGIDDNYKLHRFSEWMDMTPRDMRQTVTCLLLGIPVVVDYNWWSHSICAIRILEVHPEDDHADIVIWNSWGDGWSDNGEGDIKGSKARPDGQIAPRVMTASFT